MELQFLIFQNIHFKDVKGCMSAAEISKQLNLQSVRKHKWQIQACCALTGEGYVIIFANNLVVENRIIVYEPSSLLKNICFFQCSFFYV